MRRAAKVDTTQREIVAAIRKLGARVIVLGGVIDLLVLWRGHVWLVDCKTPTKTGKFTKTQTQDLLELAGWPIQYWTSAEQAIEELCQR